MRTWILFLICCDSALQHPRITPSSPCISYSSTQPFTLALIMPKLNRKKINKDYGKRSGQPRVAANTLVCRSCYGAVLHSFRPGLGFPFEVECTYSKPSSSSCDTCSKNGKICDNVCTLLCLFGRCFLVRIANGSHQVPALMQFDVRRLHECLA